MIGVIDTSALIRLFIPDGPMPNGLEIFFRGVEQGRNTAIAPELLLAETANVLNRKRKSGELSDVESRSLLADINLMPIRYFPHGPLATSAFDLAAEHDLTVYDALYLALAIQKAAVIFAADQKIIHIAETLHLTPQTTG